MISYDIDSLLYVGRYKAAKRISYMFPSSFAANKLFIKNNKKNKTKRWIPVASRCDTPAVLELKVSASHQAGVSTGCLIHSNPSNIRDHYFIKEACGYKYNNSE